MSHSLQRASKPRQHLNRNLSLSQIENMDSIFSTSEELENQAASPALPAPPGRKLGFLDLPPEIRNQIYFLVFAPAAPGMCLFPSAESLNSLAFLHTCRQIHAEARILAYTLSYTVTNRWHRQDLLEMSQFYDSLPSMVSEPITRLELQTQWRLPHFDKRVGTCEFFDGFTDWSWWIWDCLELFSGLKALKIVHTWRSGVDGLAQLKSCLDVDMRGLTGYRTTNISEPAKWTLASQPPWAKKLILVGTQHRTLRQVEIVCVAVNNEDLARYSERSYGWNARLLGKSWLNL